MRRREELVTAARRVIGRDGFAGATVGTITREAGASLGLLNYHFGSKDEVVAEAFAAAAREDLASLEAISRRFEDPAERLAAYLDQSEWADQDSWRLWVDAWGESVHSPLVRDTLGRFDVVEIFEAPNDETAYQILIEVARHGQVTTETLRAFSREEAEAIVRAS